MKPANANAHMVINRPGPDLRHNKRSRCPAVIFSRYNSPSLCYVGQLYFSSCFYLEGSGSNVKQRIAVSLEHFPGIVLVAYLRQNHQVFHKIIFHHVLHIVLHYLTPLSFLFGYPKFTFSFFPASLVLESPGRHIQQRIAVSLEHFSGIILVMHTCQTNQVSHKIGFHHGFHIILHSKTPLSFLFGYLISSLLPFYVIVLKSPGCYVQQ